MPLLTSGRHVALSASPYLDAITSGPDESKYFAIVALRLNASTPDKLRNHLVIGYFVEGEGTPPHAPSYNSGFCVADVLDGRTDWLPAEIDEFRAFLGEPRSKSWLQAQFEEINQAIEANSVWTSDLLQNDPASRAIDPAMIKRAIIQKSAMEPTAMTQLRARKRSS